jgi:hypothetical protein
MVTPANMPSLTASATPVVWLALLRITAPGEPAVCLVNNSEEVTSRGQVYQPFPFAITLPADDSDSLPTVTLTLSNVDRSLVEYIRGALNAPHIEVELVTSAYPDTVEKSLTFLKLGGVQYDAITITGSLSLDNFLTQSFPAESYTPPYFPALFR